MNKAFGFMGIGPCGVGMVASDTCFKSAHVDLVWYGRPNENTPHQNDFITIVSGDYAAIKSCTEAVFEKAASLLAEMGSYPQSILEFGQS